MGIQVSPHAASQAESRSLQVTEIVSIVKERCEKVSITPERTEVAVLVGYLEDGGWQGFSNGNVVWAIVRNGVLATVMFRRQDQPSTPQALRVRKVIA